MLNAALLTILSITLLLATTGAHTRVYRRRNEVGVVNLCDANVRIRCQSVLSDKRDVFLGPHQQLRYRFLDTEGGNRHFWCDAYGLFGFWENFDVYGRSAPSRRNITWFLKPDGLYMDSPQNQVARWNWVFPPMETYAED
ncbi:unnamed protein product [Nippostrongylus brasiliensis]|uniref:S-protein homolog n=1 Tax=Nippostrongylus brasiliensis TaxID=27835 RepID=A0A0N4Y693_NIPBR|nr:hypothetical protein Q1695_013056 [Nippostrongylus brasiliensis]VDL75181.1 unnamed protein product [Nippostrongylus brasiliensis]